MSNRILITFALSVFFFQIAFSIIYSNIIVKINLKFTKLQSQYLELVSQNQKLEIDYANKFRLTP